MSARSIWKGKLHIGRQALPVKLYSAVTDHTVHFHLLDKRTRTRVKQHMVHPETGDEVPNEEIQKGFEVEPGVFVVLREEELARLEPEAARDIEVVRFVPVGAIDPQWYERPYFLGPDGDAAGYFALAEALARQKKEGVAKWVMRKKQYFGALRAQDGYLALVTLRNAEEVLLPQELPEPQGRGASKTELRMAEELISVLEGEFNAEEFRDEYRDRVVEFLEARARGKRPKLVRMKPRRAAKDLESDLARSIEAMKRGKEREVA
ncbi:MAG TPA: Ku protein [Candidatus Limnocylindrales bacterium]|nr:Ku protein [Candidatus Limnocylindrales bacterium]